MSILETVRGRVASKPLLPGDVQKELATAQAELASLESQHGDAALDAMLKVQGAERRLEDLNRQLAAGRERVQTLHAAHRTALDREEAAILAQRAGLQAAQRKAAIKHLEARDAAAVALAAALADAAKHYRALLERSAKAQAACPMIAKWPEAALCGSSDLRTRVVGEMYRVSAKGGRDDLRLPGAEFIDVNFEWNPQGMTALAEQVKTANAFAIGKLTGKASE